jgi:hypothetical protein
LLVFFDLSLIIRRLLIFFDPNTLIIRGWEVLFDQHSS